MFGWSGGGKTGSLRREMVWIVVFAIACIPGFASIQRIPWSEGRDNDEKVDMTVADDYELVRQSIDSGDEDVRGKGRTSSSA
jgi:hypothetical protein